MPIIKVERDDILREDEVNEMLEKAEELYKGKMIQCLIALLWLFGKRISETIRLRRKDIWVDDNYLYVRFRVLKKKSRKAKPKLESRIKKITLKNPYVVYVLQYIKSIKNPNAYVFPGNTRPKIVTVKRKLPNGTIKTYQYEYKEGGHISREYAYRLLKELNPDVWCHLFRESVATLWAEHGATEEKLMHWFDWDRADTAHKYVKRGTRLIEDMAERNW